MIVAAVAVVTDAAAEPTPPLAPDIPPNFVEAKPNADFERRELMIPMRDGVKLKTILVIPKGITKGPILLSRTPYNAAKRMERAPAVTEAATLGAFDDMIAAD